MAYTINLTNGAIYAVIPDGQINETNDALTLVGKNFTGYGENIGENFVHLLENSADATFPGVALTGQLWFDTATAAMKVYAGNTAGWKSLGGTAPTATEPPAEKSEVGDIWFDTATEQTYIYNSSEYILIGQVGPVSAGKAGPISTNNNGHEIVEYWANGELVAIMSKDAPFTPNPGITGFATISPGFQLSSTASSGNAVFTGTASNALLLDNIASTGFLSTINNDTTAGTLGIVNDGGLTLGLNNDGQLKVVGNDVILSNVTSTGDMVFEVWNGGAIQAITIDGTTGHAMVPNIPVAGLDITNKDYVIANFLDILTAAISTNAVESSSTTVDVSLADAPTTGQVLTASSGTVASWQTPSTGGDTPVGGIIMYSGTLAAIPSNWKICNGLNGTPDLVNSFVYGTATDVEIGDTGGTADSVVVSHSHSITDPGHTHAVYGHAGGDGYPSMNDGAGSPYNRLTTNATGITINNAGVSGTGLNIPPYVKLAYIMRTS